ncbi:MAG TPA: AAA family ATPase [Candidatus Binatia bacterium]|jgi:general secretion pathway protein A
MIDLISSQQDELTFENYFGFRETPFGVTPDPRFFYGHPLYLEGLAALVYGIKAKKGLILLTGEVGTGKTILLRKLMRQLETTVQFVFISSSHITSYGLVELMIQDLNLISKEKSRLEMIHELNEHLLQQLKRGQTVALLIDEGQNLSDDALEGLCTLSNLETEEEKLLQIILVGQPELATRLTKSSFRRIKQRIAIHHRLHPLQTVGEVEDYVRHRLRVVGYDGSEIFNREAIEAVWYYSAGTPRLINIVCDSALAMTCQTFKKKVSAYTVMKAASALLLERGHEAPKLGVPEAGAPRVKTPAKMHHKKADGNGIDFDNGASFQRTVVHLQPGDMADTEANAAVVCAQFFDYMTRIATAAMGPMAHLVLRDQIAALGESRDAFPRVKLNQLVELVSREILNETMRDRFQNMMFQEMEALQPLRV